MSGETLRKENRKEGESIDWLESGAEVRGMKDTDVTILTSE